MVLVAGTAVKKNRELLDGRWDKNDTKDAANVADLITQGKCLFYDFPSLDLRELRSLLSLKRRLKKSEQGYKVRIRNHLIAQYFPEMDDYFTYIEGPHIVRNCLDPKRLADLDFQEFVRMVPSGNGRQKEAPRGDLCEGMLPPSAALLILPSPSRRRPFSTGSKVSAS